MTKLFLPFGWIEIFAMSDEKVSRNASRTSGAVSFVISDDVVEVPSSSQSTVNGSSSDDLVRTPSSIPLFVVLNWLTVGVLGSASV